MLLKLSTPCQLDRKIFIWARPYAVELAIFLKLVKKSSYKKNKILARPAVARWGFPFACWVQNEFSRSFFVESKRSEGSKPEKSKTLTLQTQNKLCEACWSDSRGFALCLLKRAQNKLNLQFWVCKVRWVSHTLIFGTYFSTGNKKGRYAGRERVLLRSRYPSWTAIVRVSQSRTSYCQSNVWFYEAYVDYE